MSFPSNPLENVLADAYAGRVPQAAFVQALVDATVWVPMFVEADGRRRPPGMEIEGRLCIPVFTSPEQADRGRQGLEVVELPVSDIVAASPESGVSVNPGGEVGLPIWAEGLRLAMDGGLAHTMAAGTRARIGLPAHDPVEFLAAVGAQLETVPSARWARRCWAQVGDAAPGLMLGVEVEPLEEETRRAVLRAVSAASIANPQEFTVDVVFSDLDADPWSWMMSNVKPFWSRD